MERVAVPPVSVLAINAGSSIIKFALYEGSLPLTLSLQGQLDRIGLDGTTELAEVIALARAGRIRAHVQRFSLTDARQAYDSLRAGRLNGRAVVIPGRRAA